MPTVAAIGTIVSAGVGVAGAVSAKKAAKKQQGQYGELSKAAAANPEGIFGSKIKFDAPQYTEFEKEDPGYANIVSRILTGDINNLGQASALSGGINQAISKATRSRIEGWDPGFMGAMNTLYKTRDETLKGRLPYDDALAITADRTRLANDIGSSGGSGPQIAADLGMKRLDLMTNTGPNLTASIVNILGAVDPVNRHTTPTDFLLRPSEAVPWAIQDKQFGAEFNFQSALTQATLDAAPDPAAQGLFNMQAFQAGLGGKNSGTQVASAIGNAFSALGSINWGSFGKGGQSGAGTYVGSPTATGPNNPPIYANAGGPAYYYNYGTGGMNQIPKAVAA